jgi:hypothetical protein
MLFDACAERKTDGVEPASWRIVAEREPEEPHEA